MHVMTDRRTYHSPLREAQANQTRTLILDTLAAMVAEDGFDGIVMRDLARRAGLAERTVYRYFPDRDALHEALAEQIAARMGWTTEEDRFDDLSELPARIEASYRQFDRDAIESAVFARLGAVRGRSAAGSTERTALIRELIAAQRPDWSEDEVTTVIAIVRTLASSRTWLWLRDDLGIDGARAGPIMRWVLELVLADIDARGGLPRFSTDQADG